MAHKFFDHVAEWTPEDEGVMHQFGAAHGVGSVAYEICIADRNDYAVMLARTHLARAGCRATRNRVMPA